MKALRRRGKSSLELEEIEGSEVEVGSGEVLVPSRETAEDAEAESRLRRGDEIPERSREGDADSGW